LTFFFLANNVHVSAYCLSLENGLSIKKFVRRKIMNKAKLIENMSKSAKMPKATCKTALEAFIEVVGKTLKGGKSVVLTGFGTFSILKRKSRVGVNPATGKKMQIPAKKVAKFKPGKALRDMVV
jgi:DNA-binding protein HU-beta